MYYKDSFLLKVIGIRYLQERIKLDVKIGEKLCNFLPVYCSPSQSEDEYENI